MRLPAPVRPGDTLAVELGILDKEVTASGRGVVRARRSATVEDELVFEMYNRTVWER